MKVIQLTFFTYLISATLVLASPVFSAVAENKVHHGERAQAAHKESFAIVDGEVITVQEFEMAYQAGIRKRFYHGKVPDEQLKAFREDVKKTLVDRVLLVQEAKRRNIKPNRQNVQAQLAKYEQRYASRPDWAQYKDEILRGLTAALEEEESLRALEEQVKASATVDDTMVRAYYKENPQLFTTPERVSVSLILLKVAPSSGADVWDAAMEEANHLVSRLKKGADFSEMARIHSGDPSASSGGALGFVHKGMLSPQAERVIQNLSMGEIGDPVMMLRGVAVFRLDQREAEQLNSFVDVAPRARQLLERDMGEKAWRDLLVQLRAQADIKIIAAGL